MRCRSSPTSRASRLPAPPPDEMRAALMALDPDAMSPRDALEALYKLRRLIEDKAQ